MKVITERSPYDGKGNVEIGHVLTLWGTDGPEAVWQELLDEFTLYYAQQLVKAVDPDLTVIEGDKK